MTIVGRLSDAPELVPTSSGQDIVKYALGTSYGPKENRQTSWWNVVSFMPEGPRRDLLMGLGKGYVGFLGVFYPFFLFFLVFLGKVFLGGGGSEKGERGEE